MDKIGNIEIRVVGKSGNLELKPENYDIKHISSILQNVEDLLYPNNLGITPESLSRIMKRIKNREANIS